MIGSRIAAQPALALRLTPSASRSAIGIDDDAGLEDHDVYDVSHTN